MRCSVISYFVTLTMYLTALLVFVLCCEALCNSGFKRCYINKVSIIFIAAVLLPGQFYSVAGQIGRPPGRTR